MTKNPKAGSLLGLLAVKGQAHPPQGATLRSEPEPEAAPIGVLGEPEGKRAP